MIPAPDYPKTALRRHLRATRSALIKDITPAARETLERALAVVAAPVTSLAHMPASYAAYGSEIDPQFIEPDLPHHAFPKVSDGTLYFYRAERMTLRPGFGNILEPDTNAPQEIPDLVLVPLIGATLAGRRLGQGAGYYDRTLARLRAAGRVTALGLAWDVQIVAGLPADPWDEMLDWIATPTRLVECARYR
ncbi:MAG: 5-formyltetrahydrofolate cyclo-ligase [Polymorphobacter sp.]